MNEQQDFWSQLYGEEYIRKNSQFDKAKGIKAWERMLRETSDIQNVLECGCNIGRNISFLDSVLPNSSKSIIEINDKAYQHVLNSFTINSSYNGPIVDASFAESFDLVYIMGVLIHIHPNDLLDNMKKLYEFSSKYILIGEYFNRTPVMIKYQGLDNKLFKRDFGKMFMEKFNVKLLDYGFLWGVEYDQAGFDDITWWLFEKE